jgi:hypothetical protein
MGRPRIIDSPEQMDELVNEYRALCKANEEPLTLTGLILHLGLSSRQSFDLYAERPEFVDSVRKAKLLIESEYEKRLATNAPTGAIFALKNFGWSDKQAIEHSGEQSLTVKWADD